MINKDFKTMTKVTCDLLKEDDNGEICEALEQMMDDELMKPDDEIDFDFIDKCTQVIYAFHEKELPKEEKLKAKVSCEQESQKNNRVKGIIERVALFAGITFIIAIAGNAISASAFHVDVLGNITEWAQNKVVFNWQDKNSSAPSSSNVTYGLLSDKLVENNLTDILLPEFNINDYKINDLKIHNTDHTQEIMFTLNKGSDYINYFVTRFSDESKMNKETLLGQYSDAQQITLNNTDFYILKSTKETRVLFRKQLTEYILSTSYNVEATKKILETIK